MSRSPLPLRLAGRQLRRSRLTSLLSAAFLALPAGALIAVNTLVVHQGCAGEPCQPTSAGIMVGAISVALPFALAIVVMSAANLLSTARRNERMLALLISVGAPPSALVRVVLASGALTGAIAGLFSLLGVPVAWLALGAVTGVDAVAVTFLALSTVVLGMLAAVVPAIVASSVDANRLLRGIPRPARGEWRTDRIGAVITTIGLAMLVVGSAVGIVLRQAYLPQFQPPFWVGAIGGLGASALTGFGPLLMIVGVLLMLPRIFRMLGRVTHRAGLAARLAARDAERQWSRSVSAGAAVLVTTFAVASYVSLAAMSTSDSAAQRWWELQEGQFAVSLIDAGYGDAVLDPRPVGDPQAIAAAVREAVATDELRIIDGVQGPYYGTPVDDSEGFSGRQELRFPEGGLPHPRLADPTVCAVETLPGWRCDPPPYYHSLGFPLRASTPTIWVGDADDLRLILGGTVDDSALDVLDGGGALVFDPRYLAADGTVSIDWHDEGFVPENEPGEFLPSGEPLRSETMAGYLVSLEHRLDYGVFVSETTARERGLIARPSRLLGSFADTAERSESFETYSALVDAAGPRAEVIVESRPSEPEPGWTVGALLLSGGITLAVALIAVGLARAESRGADRTLAALGADPRIRRRISAWYALLVVGTGTIVGTALGVLWASSAMVVGSGGSLTALPWVELAVLAGGMPLLAAALGRLTPNPREGFSAG